ncbi:polyamine aminopropyltransferase [Sphingobium sp. CAP-1]|uniref:polyamine aminopropyltransferase n=1 Tax=Sphingobium sp. CAP-1 TaxID=2676077 RepID=UPI0012BB4584|nr:polyamine aminopropyltransferase [Sphingobium sp. CAP-1]QGP80376.1 polyamine aminopropyltransferase [Sphingobium sp. CAP-1]
MADTPLPPTERRRTALVGLLLASVFAVATCGLIYELLAGTIASYLLGDSVTQFSTIIGTYLFAMGVGSWCSRYVKRDELRLFIRVEILVALLGGWSAAALFLLFPLVEQFRPILYLLVFVIGLLVGLEIPLLMRILRDRFDFSETVSNVLTFDYVGALAASLLFPLLLVPHLGLIRTGLMFGLLNAGVALLLLLLVPARASLMRERILALIVIASLIAGFLLADRIQRWSEIAAYGERVIYATSSPYQRLVLTRHDDDIRLYLNGNLQFSSRDEYRYHEALVHPAMGRVARPANVLILGGGDGLAAREVFRHPDVRSVTLVDLDPAMTRLFSDTGLLTSLNHGALTDRRMHVVNADAFRWVRETTARFDVIIVDFPDPVDFSVGKLYTESFYRMLRPRLAPGGMAVIQSTSPLVAPAAFWTVAHTLEAVGFHTRPYHVYVPSFGEWGFILAGLADPGVASRLLPGNRFLSDMTARQAQFFPPDMARRPVPVNRLDNQALVRSFAEEWARYEG